MNKNNNLYFIPILAKAFESDEPIEAIEKALFEIKELGKRTEYRIGYEQFNGFLKSGIQSQENKSDELLEQLLVGLESNSLKIPFKEQEELKERIKSNPTLLKKYLKIVEEHKTDAPLAIEIYQDEKLFGTQNLLPKEDELIFTNIVPQNYSIRLSNGRVLWEGGINSEDVTFDESHPQREYSLAAETDESDIKPTLTIELIKDEMQLYVYAGLEFGKFKIVIK